MDGLNPQIPMAAAQQQPSFAQQAGEALSLAGAVEKQRDIQTQRQDQQNIQQYLKQGGNLNTPEGLAAATEWAKDNLSAGGYQTITTAAQEMKANEQKRLEAMAKADEATLSAQMKKQDFIAQNLTSLVNQYEEDVKQVGTQEAETRFNQNRDRMVQGIGQMGAGGRPVIEPEMLQSAAQMNPGQAKAALQGTTYWQDQTKKAMEMKKLQADTAAAEALAEQRRRAAKGGAGGIPEEITQSGATGQELLDMLPPGQAAQVKAIAEGRVDLSSIPARGGAREKYAQLVSQYNPEFSGVAYKTKAAVQKGYTSGKEKTNIDSINTSIGHLGTLNQLGVALQNKDSQTLNRITNAIAGEFGDPRITNYQLAQSALGEELMKTFRGAGASVTEAQEWKAQLSAARTPQQMLQVVRTASELLESRINALDEGYKRGMESDKGFKDILTPKAANTLTALTGKDYWKMYNLTGAGRAAGAKAEEGAPATKPATTGKGAGDFSHLWR